MLVSTDGLIFLGTASPKTVLAHKRPIHWKGQMGKERLEPPYSFKMTNQLRNISTQSENIWIYQTTRSEKWYYVPIFTPWFFWGVSHRNPWRNKNIVYRLQISVYGSMIFNNRLIFLGVSHRIPWKNKNAVYRLQISVSRSVIFNNRCKCT